VDIELSEDNLLEKDEKCYKCNKDPLTKQGGVLYVRAQKNPEDKWESLAICPSCWNELHPEKKVDT